MKKFLSIFTLLLSVSVALHAVPAKPVKKAVKLADGSTVELTLRGDEHFSFYTDDEGNPFVMNGNGIAQPVAKQLVTERWTSLKNERLAYTHRAATAINGKRRIAKAGTPSTVTTGKQRGLVILVEFPDVPFVTENPKAVFNRFFNEEGYSEYGNTGSVKDFFLKQSYGQLEIDFDVVGPYTVSQEMAYYGKPNGDANDTHPALMVAEAADAASKEVNFANYDWDGDRTVDQVFVVYAGYNQAQGADANTIWPHEWSLAGEGATRNYNGRTINTYGCSSELMGSGRNGSKVIDGVGTACHEFSHCLGLPDMYDTNGKNFGMSVWDVMDQGSYNDNSHTPAGYTSYERMFARWLTPTEITTETRITDMKPLATTPEAYILYNDKNKNEFYMLENRQAIDFDKGLYGHGLLILHVDYNEESWSKNTLNNSANHQRMTIIPADNRLTMDARGLAGDPWPGVSGNKALTNITTPAATLFNPNTDGSLFLNKPIENISENTTTHTISMTVCRPPLGVPVPDDGKEVAGQAAFTVTWLAVDRAVGYELELTEVGSSATDPSEALLREYHFEECYTKSVGFSDISSKLENYGLNGWSGSKLYTSPNKLRFGTSSANGTLVSPFFMVPQSSETTIVMGADVVKGDVSGTLHVHTANQGDSYSAIVDIPCDFHFSGNGKYVFHFSTRKELFRLSIEPTAQMYLNYLAFYDGNWSPEQLGIDNNDALQSVAPRKAPSSQTFTTATNSYTFENLNSTSRYYYRVRSLGEDNAYSEWSDEKLFAFADGIASMVLPASADGMTRVYDTFGRLVYSAPSRSFSVSDIPARGILLIRDGQTTRKVVK